MTAQPRLCALKRSDAHQSRCVVGVLSVILLASLLLSVSLGSQPTAFMDVLHGLIRPQHSDIQLILYELRLPRTLLAILVGAALAVSGLILQKLVRNPLASPDVIGISSGASVAAVLVLTLGAGVISERWLPLAAMAGAALVALGIVTLAWPRGVTPTRLVLMGIGIAAALGAVTTLLLVLSTDTSAMYAYIWMTGSLYATQWPSVIGMLPWVALGLPLAFVMARQLDVLSLGDELAIGLGSQVTMSRLKLLGLSVMLTGAAIAYAGGLSFIGLIAPHIARRLVVNRTAALLPVTALIGALLLLYADLIGRLAFLPRDLPAGIFVAGIGAPFLIYLLYRWQRH